MLSNTVQVQKSGQTPPALHRNQKLSHNYGGCNHVTISQTKHVPFFDLNPPRLLNGPV